jgi:Phospholipase/Carboxylesterase
MNRRFVFLTICLVSIAACSSRQEVINRDSESAIDSSPALTQTAVTTPTSLPTTVPASISTEPEMDATTAPAPTEEVIPTSIPPTAPSPFALESISPGQEMAYAFQSTSGEVIHYWLYIPDGYDDSRSWPLIISLPGLGFDPSLERVRKLSPMAFVGPEVEFPFIVISPRGPDGPWNLYHEPIEELIGLLGESLSIDSEAQFLIGLSNSAAGAWQWALASPDRFTGLALVAGPPSSALYKLDPEATCTLRDLPIWIGHSEKDELAPIESTRAAVMALENCGSTKVTFTEYLDLNHAETWATAFGGPELYDWMLALAE